MEVNTFYNEMKMVIIPYREPFNFLKKAYLLWTINKLFHNWEKWKEKSYLGFN